MSGFTEDWPRDYKTRRHRESLPKLDVVQFTLAKPVKLLNETIRMHWRARTRYAKALATEIARNHPGIGEPMQKARVEIVRYSVREPDHDGLLGGCKQLIDCLLVRSPRHPHGLGYIVDDSPAHMVLEARHEKAATLKAQGTMVRIVRAA